MARGKSFNSNSERLSDYLRDRIKRGDIHRPKYICPVCFRNHIEDIPEKCWFKGLKGDISLQTEFEKYVKQNKKGIIVS